MPKIVYESLEEKSRGNFPGYLLTGEKEDGTSWNTFFFKTIKGKGGKEVANPMVEIIKGAPVGSTLNVIMEKNGKYWNAVDVEVLAEGSAPADKPKGNPKKQEGPANYNRAGNSSAGRVPYRHPDNVDRSASVNSAVDLLKILVDTGALGKTPKEDLLITKFQELTGMIHGFINKGKGFTSACDDEAELPDNMGDDVPPGEPGDDDIPF